MSLNLNIINLSHSRLSICLALRNYAFKSDLKIKWVRPEKVPAYKPEKSGDLESVTKVDKTKLSRVGYEQSKELSTANDLVKRLFTLEFAPHGEHRRYYTKELMDSVRRSDFDDKSVEAKVAKWTSIIRFWQEDVERYPRNVRKKVMLSELIDRRKKILKYLRQWDYKRFEWLLEKLNLEYKPVPEERIKVTRKDSLRKLTKNYCDDLVNERLNEYKAKLQAQQPAFLEEKIRILQFIRNEQITCKTGITVTQEQIDKVKAQLEELQTKTQIKENDE